MNKEIWQYKLEIDDTQTIKMPKDAKILTIQCQYETPCIWALVDPANKKEDRLIETFGTGNSISCGIGNDRKYIGTYQKQGGLLIFHVFEYTGI